MNRRSLLRALGAAGLAGAAGGLPAKGAVAAVPAKRVLFYVSSHGTVYSSWKMHRGRDPDADWEYDLAQVPADGWSPILAPLQPYASRLLVLDGLANHAAMTSRDDAHFEGAASCLSGRVPAVIDGQSGRTDGPSVDQVIAATRTTPIRSLEYALDGVPCAFDDGGHPLPFEQDPFAAWDRLFPTASTGGVTRDVLRRRQPRALDFAASRFDAMAARSPADRERLEQHGDLVRALGEQITRLAELDCAPLPYPSPLPSYDAAAYPEATTSLFAELAAAAFACGVTDVITLRQALVHNATIGAPPGDLHTEYAHAAWYDADAEAVMVTFQTWHARRFADLLARLDALADPDGGTLLDHTLVVWTNELAEGHHTFHDLPIVVAGAPGAIRTGRYVRWKAVHPPIESGDGPWLGPPHNRFLAAVAAATGIELTGVGAPSFTAWDGTEIDATGVLDRVLV